MDSLKMFNEYLADLSVWTMKLHNMHWNVKGMQFMPVHLFTDGEYNKSFERMDGVAEHIKMFGHLPASTLKEQLEIAHIKEEPSRDFKDSEVLEIIMKDMEILREKATALRNVCDEKSWFSAVSLFEEHIADYNKQLWFIGAMLEK